MADLGSWLDGAYRIGAPLSESDLDEGLPTEGHAGSEAGMDKHSSN